MLTKNYALETVKEFHATIKQWFDEYDGNSIVLDEILTDYYENKLPKVCKADKAIGIEFKELLHICFAYNDDEFASCHDIYNIVEVITKQLNKEVK